ncbi:MAG: hypothetical protein SOH80_02070 [Eubacteriales bacterium]|jgi:hypothetical protein
MNKKKQEMRQSLTRTYAFPAAQLSVISILASFPLLHNMSKSQKSSFFAGGCPEILPTDACL